MLEFVNNDADILTMKHEIGRDSETRYRWFVTHHGRFVGFLVFDPDACNHHGQTGSSTMFDDPITLSPGQVTTRYPKSNLKFNMHVNAEMQKPEMIPS